MDMLTGGQLVARMLKKEGVGHGLHPLRPPHRAHLRGAGRGGNPDRRHPPRAGRGARRGRLGPPVARRGRRHRDRGPGRHRRGDRRRQRLGGELPAPPHRRSRPHLQPGARLPPGDAPDAALPGHHQVERSGALAGAAPELPGQGLPRGPRRPTRAGLPGDPLGRPLERRRRGDRRRDHPLPDRRPLAGRPAPGGGGHRAPRRGRAAGDPGRLVDLVGRRLPGPRSAGPSHRHPGLPERHGARLPAAGPRRVLPAHPQGGARRGRRGAARGDPARLPRGLRLGAHLRRRGEGDPGGHRRRRDRAQPPHRRGHRRRFPQRARAARGGLEGGPGRPRVAPEAARERVPQARTGRRPSRGATSAPSTTSGSARRSTPRPGAPATSPSSPTAGTSWPWRPRASS